MTPGLAAVVLAAFEKADDFESLSWRITHDPGREAKVRLFVNCSDFFHLATADCEEIEAADVDLLEQCFADLKAAGDNCHLPELFAARKRKMRPHASARKGMTPAVGALFDACSTEEERAEVDRKDRAFWAHVAHKARSEREPS